MDTDKCMALMKTLELGSQSAAAEELGYTPSGISRMMASLESELGFSLLIRSRDGIRPTRECEEMMPYLRSLVAETARVIDAANSLKGVDSGHIIVGTPYPLYFRKLSGLISEFCLKYPGIYVEIIDGMSAHYSDLIEQRRADFCIISRRPGDIEWQTLTEDPMVVLVSDGHPLTAKGYVSREDLEREPFIELYPGVETDQYAYFRSTGIRPNIRYSSSNTLAAHYMVEAGLGITIDNQINAAGFVGNLAALPLEEPYIVPIGIATPKAGRLSPAARKFIEMAEEYFRFLL